MIWPFSTIAKLRAELARLHAVIDKQDSHSLNLSRLLSNACDARDEAEIGCVELTRERDEVITAKMELARQLAEACRERDEWCATAGKAFEAGWSERLKQESQNNRLSLEEAARLARWGKALEAIAAQETPGANATVKRMAKLAREELE